VLQRYSPSRARNRKGKKPMKGTNVHKISNRFQPCPNKCRNCMRRSGQARQNASRGNTSGVFASTGTGSRVSFSAACAPSCPSGPHPLMSWRLKPMTGPASRRSGNSPAAFSKNAPGSRREHVEGLSMGQGFVLKSYAWSGGSPLDRSAA
jgi:hypothetical protein